MVILSILKDLCKEKGITLTKLATEIGMAQSAISESIKRNNLTLANLDKIAKYLNVPVGLFFGEDNKSEKILAILNKAFADDIKRTDDIVQAIDRAKVVFEDMKINDNPELQKKFVNYQQEQYTKALDNQYLFVLMKLNTEDLKKLVTLDYISKDVFTLIELLKRFAKNPIVKEMAKKSIKNALKGGLDDTALD